MRDEALELGLAEQEALEQRLLVVLQVGQHAQFLERRERHVLHFVDDQQNVLVLLMAFDQEGFERAQQRRLVEPLERKAEGRCDHAQRIVRLELRRHDGRGDEVVAVDAVQQMTDERRLAGADFAGDHDKAVSLGQPVGQIRHRLLMAPASEEEPVVGAELKWTAA